MGGPRNVVMIVSLLLSVALGLALGRGAADPAAERRILQIGLSLDTLKEERWQNDRDQFVARCQELGAEVHVQSANSDDVRQIQDVDRLIELGVDCLVIVPHDGVAMAKAVASATQAGIPVIAYDRLIASPELDLYLSFDNVRVGELQARYLVDRLGTRKRIVRIYGAPTDHNAKLFKEGQDRVLQPLIDGGRIEVVHEDWAEDWKPENAKRIMEAALTRHGHAIDGVLASNDGTASGAIQALIEEGLAGKVLVTGQDAELAACQRIAAGTQTMTIYKPLRTLARGAAEIAVRLAAGRSVIARDGIPLETGGTTVQIPAALFEVVAVDRGNLMETVIADGFQDYEQVYRAVPEAERPPRP